MCIIGPMEGNMKGSGTMGNSMARESMSNKMVPSESESGKAAKENAGLTKRIEFKSIVHLNIFSKFDESFYLFFLAKKEKRQTLRRIR